MRDWRAGETRLVKEASMPKVRKRLTRKDKERLSREAGQAFGKAHTSKYEQKTAAVTPDKNTAPSVQSPKTAPVFEKAASPVPPRPVPATSSASSLISSARRNSPDAMVTGAYFGGAAITVLGPFRLPPLADAKLSGKPSFLLAEVKDSQWQVTRFTGDILPDGRFTGAEDTITLGPVSDNSVRRRLFSAMIDWAQEQGVGKLDRLPQKVFGPAQNIYGLDPRTGPARRFDR